MSKERAKRKKPDRSKPKLKRAEYEAEMAKLHAELVEVQYWVKHSGARIVVVFEGRDAAGKGGVIKRITERFRLGSTQALAAFYLGHCHAGT